MICDKCGKPITSNQARYTIADKQDDDGNWTIGRHHACHKSSEEIFAEGDALLKKANDLIGRLKGSRR